MGTTINKAGHTWPFDYALVIWVRQIEVVANWSAVNRGPAEEIYLE
jgi:hypothetical protein